MMMEYCLHNRSYFIENKAHFFQKNDYWILPAHYTWKVVWKGLKIKWIMWCWERFTSVNFTNVLRAAFAPKAFCHKITNPNCKLIKAAQRALVWLSILQIFYEQLFHTKVPCTAFMFLQFGFVILWQKAFGAKDALKTLVKLTPGWNILEN